jgi:hypothetical protein
MKKTDVRAGSTLSFSQVAHVFSTRSYASTLGTSSWSDQCLDSGLLRKLKQNS